MNSQKGFTNLIVSLILVVVGAIFVVAIVPNLTNQPSDWTTRTLINELLHRGGNVIYADTPGDVSLNGNLYTQNIYPSLNNTYSVGSPTAIYTNGYFDELYASNFTVESMLFHDIFPTTNNTYSVGSPSLLFSNGYYDNITANNLLTGSISPSYNNTYNVGSASNMYANGYFNDLITNYLITGSIQSGHLYPSVNTTYDIGTDNLYWRKLFVSNDANILGTVNISGSLYVGDTDFDALTLPGILHAGNGVYSDSSPLGAGLYVDESTATVSQHIAIGSFAYTGGLYNNLFTSTTPIFEGVDAINRNFIILLSGDNYGAIAEVDYFIDASNVIVETSNWTTDIASSSFAIVSHPSLYTGDGNRMSFSTGSSGSVEFDGFSRNGENLFQINAESFSINGSDVFAITCNATGKDDISAIDILYNTGASLPNSDTAMAVFSLDETGAITSDNTTHIDVIHMNTTNTTSMEKHAIHIGRNFDTALIVEGADAEDPTYGYYGVSANATVVNHVTGAPQVGTAYLKSSASNVRLFNAVNDYVLIGSAQPFESVQWIASVPSSHSILPTFQYSSGNGTWANLSVSDSTNGFTKTGKISFYAPGAWSQTSAVAIGGPTITTGYYFRINRTRLGTLPVFPIESYFQTFPANAASNFIIRGDGSIQPASMTDARATPDSIYFSITGNALSYKDDSGVVHALY